MDELDLEEATAEVELNEEEAPFLAGQTDKTCTDLKPVKITNNPDGSLQRAALMQSQKAGERRDIREQRKAELKA